MGAGSSTRTAGMIVSSMTSAETMPKPVKRPKVRIVAVWNVASEQNESAATTPAAIITGPTCTSDATTASRTSGTRSYSS